MHQMFPMPALKVLKHSKGAKMTKLILEPRSQEVFHSGDFVKMTNGDTDSQRAPESLLAAQSSQAPRSPAGENNFSTQPIIPGY